MTLESSGLPRPQAVGLVVDAGQAEQFVAEGGDGDHVAALVTDVIARAFIVSVEDGAGKQEGMGREFHGLGVFRGFGSRRGFVLLGLRDEVADRALRFLALGILDEQENVHCASSWRQRSEARVFFVDRLLHRGMSRFGAQQQQGGVDMAGLGLDRDDRLVLLAVLGARDEFEHAFYQTDAGIDVHGPLLDIDFHAGHDQLFERGPELG